MKAQPPKRPCLGRYGHLCPVLLLGLTLFLPAAAWSHPHVFIGSTLEFRFSGNSLSDVRLEWTFDAIFSGTLMADYDRDRNGVFSAAEQRELKAGAFDNLKNYGYFSHLTVGTRSTPVSEVQDFSAIIDQGTVVYRFTVPLRLQARATDQEIRLSVYDDTYFVAFDVLKANKVRITRSPAVTASVAVKKGRAEVLYPGQVLPDDTVLVFRSRQ